MNEILIRAKTLNSPVFLKVYHIVDSEEHSVKNKVCLQGFEVPVLYGYDLLSNISQNHVRDMWLAF